MDVSMTAAGAPAGAGRLDLPRAAGGAGLEEGLLDEVMRLFSVRMNITVPSPETDIIQSGLLDSLKLVELLFQIEQVFQVKVAVESLSFDTFRTAREIARFVAAERTGKA